MSILDEIERRVKPGYANGSLIGPGDTDTLLRLARLGAAFLSNGMGKGEPPHYNEIGWAHNLLYGSPPKGIVTWSPEDGKIHVVAEGKTLDEAKAKFAPPPAATWGPQRDSTDIAYALRWFIEEHDRFVREHGSLFDAAGVERARGYVAKVLPVAAPPPAAQRLDEWLAGTEKRAQDRMMADLNPPAAPTTGEVEQGIRNQLDDHGGIATPCFVKCLTDWVLSRERGLKGRLTLAELGEEAARENAACEARAKDAEIAKVERRNENQRETIEALQGVIVERDAEIARLRGALTAIVNLVLGDTWGTSSPSVMRIASDALKGGHP